MQYVKHEVQKLVNEKAFLLFGAFCLFLNLTIIGIALPDGKYLSEIAQNIGQFRETGQEQSLFEGYDAREIGKYYYNEYYLDTHFLNRVLYWKYGEVGKAVERLGKARADQSIIAAERTTQLYEGIFAVLIKSLLIEGILLIAFVLFYLWSFENANDMDGMIYSSTRGRKLVRDKMISGMIYCTSSLFILYVFSLMALRIRLPYRFIWDGYVSSAYHVVTDYFLPFNKPFITWFPIKFSEYMVLSLLMAAGIYFFCFCFVCYLVAKSGNVWKGIITLCIIFLCPIVFSGIFERFQMWWCFSLNNVTVPMLVFHSHLWFSEMGVYELIPLQEVWSVLVHVILGAVLLCRAFKIFKEKEMV